MHIYTHFWGALSLSLTRPTPRQGPLIQNGGSPDPCLPVHRHGGNIRPCQGLEAEAEKPWGILSSSNWFRIQGPVPRVGSRAGKSQASRTAAGVEHCRVNVRSWVGARSNICPTGGARGGWGESSFLTGFFHRGCDTHQYLRPSSPLTSFEIIWRLI